MSKRQHHVMPKNAKSFKQLQELPIMNDCSRLRFSIVWNIFIFPETNKFQWSKYSNLSKIGTTKEVAYWAVLLDYKCKTATPAPLKKKLLIQIQLCLLRSFGVHPVFPASWRTNTYILKVKKSAESTFQFPKICGKSA